MDDMPTENRCVGGGGGGDVTPIPFRYGNALVVCCSYYFLAYLHYSKKLKEHFDIMIFIERYPLKRCQGCVKLIASKSQLFFKH